MKRDEKNPNMCEYSWRSEMNKDKSSLHLKNLIRVVSVAGIICLPIFGCGKSGSDANALQKTSNATSVESVIAQNIGAEEENAGDANADAQGSIDSSVDGNADMQGTVENAIDANNDAQGSMDSSVNANADIQDAVEDEADTADPSVDIDLTALSATMVYSEVFQMMYYPEDYIGKTVKMEGLFDHYHDDATGKDYYACIIKDATACCAQGIEFQLTDGQYPADSTNDVAVKGTFETYEEDGAKYCTLVDAELLN